MLIFNGLVVVAIITMIVVVVIKRRGGRTRLLQEVLLHQLRQQRVRHQSPPRLQMPPLADIQNHSLGVDPASQAGAAPNNTATDPQSTMHSASRQSHLYEIVNDDDSSDEGTGVNEEASDAQVDEKNAPVADDSLPPTASAQNVLVTQSRDPVYQNQSQQKMKAM
ncbi:uncharacterized protein [Littorina saxatilis]|uniref:uncharacterized protein n=1 Tax=Littorina saxatilis TaxID=31220 RepID=UPI0038B4A02F